MKHLLDSNVFVASTFSAHLHHGQATSWIESLERPEKIYFCRSTEISFLRLLTQISKYTKEAATNMDAYHIYLEWRAQPGIAYAEEPVKIQKIWPKMGANAFRSPKLWMDAYLAAFAISGDFQLVTFDRGFEQFKKHGLRLLLLA